MQGGVGAKMGVLIQCRCMSRTSHTRVHPGRASPSGMTCLEKCVPMSLCNRQLASSNTIISFCTFIYNSIHFLKTLSHTHTHTHQHTHTHIPLPLSLPFSLSISFDMSVHVRRAAPPIRRRQLYITSPRRSTVNPLSRPRRPSAAVAPTGGMKKSRFSTNISLYLQNDARQSHSYYGRRIGNRTQAFEWYRFERP